MLEEEAEEEPFLGHSFLFGESHNSLAFWPKFIDPNIGLTLGQTNNPTLKQKFVPP